MKKIIAASVLVLILAGASAQFRGERGFAFAPRATVVVAANPYWGYSPFYYPYAGMGYYPYFGYPYGANYGYRPYSQLDKQIANINHDYDQRIEAVRSDGMISGKERRLEIRDLKKERDNAVDNAKRNYFNSLRSRQYQQQQQAPPVQQQTPPQQAVPQTPATEPQNNNAGAPSNL